MNTISMVPEKFLLVATVGGRILKRIMVIAVKPGEAEPFRGSLHLGSYELDMIGTQPFADAVPTGQIKREIRLRGDCPISTLLQDGWNLAD